MKITIAPDLARYEVREHNPYACPIATDITRKLAKEFRASVSEDTIRIHRRSNNSFWADYSIPTDYNLADWVHRYDMGLIVPTDVTFDINIPDAYVRV